MRVLVADSRAGYRRNFLRAASRSTAPLIAFCDQDDVWHPEKLERMARAFARPEVLLAYHNARVVDADGLELGALYGRRGARARTESLRTDPWSFSLGFTQVFRRELLGFGPLHERSRDFLFPEERLAHDQWFFFLAAALGEVRFVDEALADYRQHGSNVFGSDDRSRPRGALAFRATLEHTPRQLAARSRSARASVDVLEAIAADPAQRAVRRTALQSLSRHYRALGGLYRARVAAYQGSFPMRSRAWLRLLARRRALARLELSYPARHAVRDLLFGVMLQPSRR